MSCKQVGGKCVSCLSGAKARWQVGIPYCSDLPAGFAALTKSNQTDKVRYPEAPLGGKAPACCTVCEDEDPQHLGSCCRLCSTHRELLEGQNSVLQRFKTHWATGSLSSHSQQATRGASSAGGRRAVILHAGIYAAAPSRHIIPSSFILHQPSSLPPIHPSSPYSLSHLLVSSLSQGCLVERNPPLPRPKLPSEFTDSLSLASWPAFQPSRAYPPHTFHPIHLIQLYLFSLLSAK